MAWGLSHKSGTKAARGKHVAGSLSRDTADVPTIAGHGLHFDSGGGQELADLGGVFKDVQRHAADNHSVQHAVVTMGGREWPSRRVLGKRVKRSANPPAAVVDVTEQFGLGEHTVGKGVGVLVKGLWRFPWLELGAEVVVEGRAARGMPGTRGLSRAILRAASDPWAPRPATGPSPTDRRDNP